MTSEPYFKVFPEFQGASYINRMALLCRRLVAERLYTAAVTITAARQDAGAGVNYREPDPEVGVDRFFDALIRRVRPR